jgi:hypothetical protein
MADCEVMKLTDGRLAVLNVDYRLLARKDLLCLLKNGLCDGLRMVFIGFGVEMAEWLIEPCE